MFVISSNVSVYKSYSCDERVSNNIATRSAYWHNLYIVHLAELTDWQERMTDRRSPYITETQLVNVAHRPLG